MDKPGKPNDLTAISDRANAVISELDRAVSEILDASEQSARVLQEIRDTPEFNRKTDDLLAQMGEESQRIIAACSVQDVIRQHLEILIRDLEKDGSPHKKQKDSEKLLAGPQLDGQVLRQQDIDDLLE